MKNVILVCNAGMSSSLMAKKTTSYLNDNGYDIHIDATTSVDKKRIFEKDKYELILVSPQVRMLFDEFSKKAKENGMKIVQVNFDAYAPIPSGIEKMAKLVLDNL